MFRRRKDVESRRRKVGVVIILSAPGKGVAVQIGTRNLSGSLGNFVVDGQDVLSNRIERSGARLGRTQSQDVNGPQLIGSVEVSVDP